MCLGKEEEPCGQLEQLSSTLDPEQGSKSLLGRFLGCLQMTSYFLSEKQNRVSKLTAKKPGAPAFSPASLERPVQGS